MHHTHTHTHTHAHTHTQSPWTLELLGQLASFLVWILHAFLLPTVASRHVQEMSSQRHSSTSSDPPSQLRYADMPTALGLFTHAYIQTHSATHTQIHHIDMYALSYMPAHYIVLYPLWPLYSLLKPFSLPPPPPPPHLRGSLTGEYSEEGSVDTDSVSSLDRTHTLAIGEETGQKERVLDHS